MKKRIANLLYLFIIVTVSLLFTEKTKCQTITSLGTGLNGTVRALTMYNGNLYAGGSFTTAGGVAANCIAEWNGTSWDSLSTGLNDTVFSLCVYKGNLYAGGAFTKSGKVSVNHLAMWNGTKWDSVSRGLNGNVYSMITYDSLQTSGPSLLMIGGAFTSSAKLSLKYLALWNGIKLDSIRRTKFDNSYIHTVPDNTVHALISDYYQDIDIGGIFSNAGSGPYLKYAGFVQFDLTQWFTDADQTVLDSNGILAFANYGTNLMVAGNGYFTSGGKKQYIGYVNLTSPPQLQWTTMGSGVNNSVYCMANYNSDIYAGGAFDTAGGLRVGYIAAWNGSTWDSVITLNNHVQSMVANGSVLYIAGDFTSAAPVISKGRNPQSASYNHIVEFNSAPNGINTINSKSEARIFPNPSNGIFTLQMKLTSENASLEVYNVLGENIYSAPMQKGANTILLNLSQQPSGIYLYRIASEQGEYITSGKLIIE